MACADQSSTPRPIKQVTGPDGAFVRGALPRNSYRQRGPYTMARGGMRGPGMTMMGNGVGFSGFDAYGQLGMMGPGMSFPGMMSPMMGGIPGYPGGPGGPPMGGMGPGGPMGMMGGMGGMMGSPPNGPGGPVLPPNGPAMGDGDGGPPSPLPLPLGGGFGNAGDQGWTHRRQACRRAEPPVADHLAGPQGVFRRRRGHHEGGDCVGRRRAVPRVRHGSVLERGRSRASHRDAQRRRIRGSHNNGSHGQVSAVMLVNTTVRARAFSPRHQPFITQDRLVRG